MMDRKQPLQPGPDSVVTLVTRERGDAQPISLPLPREFTERYQLLQALGAGGCGVVHLALQLSTQRRVAIKMLMRLEDERLATRFRAEVLLLAQLSHPNVVPIFDSGWVGDHPYLVMELLPGTTLRSRLQEEGPLRNAGGIATIRDLLRGLAACHDRGIVHRDLKPENVMFNQDGRAVLVDLGIALARDGSTRLTDTGGIIGTPAYMAPEQWNSEPVTPATDVYAAGVLFFEMLAGRAPFQADSIPSFGHLHCNQPAPALTQIWRDAPPRLAAVVHQSLEKQPGRRFPSAREMLVALEDASALATPSSSRSRKGVAVPVAPVAPAAPAERRTGRTAAVAAGALVATLAVLATTLYLRPRRSSDLPVSQVTATAAPRSAQDELDDLAAAVTESGYGPLSAEQLLSLPRARVTPGLIRAYRTAGLVQLSIDDLVSLTRERITTTYIEAFARQGHARPDVRGLVDLHQNRVTARLLGDLARLGYSAGPHWTMKDVKSLASGSIPVDLLESLRDSGYPPLPVSQLAELQAHGVSAEYVRGLKEVKFSQATGLTLDRMLALRDRLIDGVMIAGYEKAGLRDLTVDQLIALADNGAPPEFVEAGMRSEKGPLSVEQIIERRASGSWAVVRSPRGHVDVGGGRATIRVGPGGQAIVRRGESEEDREFEAMRADPEDLRKAAQARAESAAELERAKAALRSLPIAGKFQ